MDNKKQKRIDTAERMAESFVADVLGISMRDGEIYTAQVNALIRVLAKEIEPHLSAN